MAQYLLPDGVVQLDELEMLVVVDNESDTLSSVDDGVPQIPEVVQHAARTPPSRKFEGHDCKVVFDQLCCACHGLSVLVTGRVGGSGLGLAVVVRTLEQNNGRIDMESVEGRGTRCSVRLPSAGQPG